jgi:hypothetical protein
LYRRMVVEVDRVLLKDKEEEIVLMETDVND